MTLNPFRNNFRIIAISLALALGTLALYLPAAHHNFISLDDNQYVTANPVVKAGLTWAGVKWAFTNIIASNWFPLTWLSHMLDCQLYGVNPVGHHLTSVFFHVANVLLLFLWLKGATGAMWRSALVAALFAWHPLRVESVAWVAERKDVLSAFFWLLALLAYTRYVKKQRAATYLLVLFLFACGLMSKPMAVTLPFVLLLADFWPLGRISKFTVANCKPLLVEKIPFFALTIAESCINFIAQKAGGATWSADALPWPVRLANALVSYVRYLSKTFWPTDLAVIYPYQNHWPLWFVFAAASLLLIWSVTVFLQARKNPFLFFGWFYFVGTLIPTIGFVQVGPQAMADRYSYLPSIGLFIIIVWGANEFLAPRLRRKEIAILASAAVLTVCLIVTSRQLAHWQNSLKLFLHTVEVTTDNYTAEAYLGSELEAVGLYDAALPLFFDSVRVAPSFPIGQWNLGMALLRQGRAAEAAEHLGTLTRLTPGDPVIICYYGKALAAAGKTDEAKAQFTEALRLKPDYVEAKSSLTALSAAPHP